MSAADQEERTRIAADLLRCKKLEEVQPLVRAMTPAERRALTKRIDGVIAWVVAYEAEEMLVLGVNA